MFVMQRHTCVRKLLLMAANRTPTQPLSDFGSPESYVRLDLVMGNSPAANVRIDGLRVNRLESRQILSRQKPVGLFEIVEDIGFGARYGFGLGLDYGFAHENSSDSLRLIDSGMSLQSNATGADRCPNICSNRR